jgi:phytoene desaturase
LEKIVPSIEPMKSSGSNIFWLNSDSQLIQDVASPKTKESDQESGG